MRYEEILAKIATWERIVSIYEGMEDKRLIGGSYVKDGMFCAIGALIPDVVMTYEFPRRAIASAKPILAALQERYGLFENEAMSLQSLNDDPCDWEFYKRYPTRYERILAYSKNMIRVWKVSQQSHSGYLTDPNRTR